VTPLLKSVVTGANRVMGELLPIPNWPSSLCPHASIAPFRTANDDCKPALTLVTLFPNEPSTAVGERTRFWLELFPTCPYQLYPHPYAVSARAVLEKAPAAITALHKTLAPQFRAAHFLEKNAPMIDPPSSCKKRPPQNTNDLSQPEGGFD
jgi:hypothetical protein